MRATQRRLFYCECGAALGVLQGRNRPGKGERLRVRILPRAVPDGQAIEDELIEASIVTLVGSGKVRCGVCGREQEWHPALQATKDFLEKRKVRNG